MNFGFLLHKIFSRSREEDASEQGRGRKVRRRINPATATVEELLSHLATHPAAGLSQTEAERRLAASAAKPLYRTPARTVGDCIKSVLREPALWLLLAVSVISLFFDRVGLGIVCLLLGVGNTALSAFFLYRSASVDAAMASYDAPVSRVLRSRRICRVGASELVRGDIVLFYPGDMIPADCRLLRTDGFVVSEREIDTDPTRPSHRLEKDAAAPPETVGSFRISPVNMVFAGGVVEEGFAIAVVIAVGSETHLGGLTGGLESTRVGKRPTLFKKAARGLSAYNLLLVFLILPVTAVGIFTLGDGYELLDLFLAALAVATVTLTEQVLAKGSFLNAVLRRKSALERDTVNSADLKSAVTPEVLTKVTDLILVGSAALHDGQSHADTLLLGERLYHIDRPEADEHAKAMVELVYLYRHGLMSYPTAGEQEGSIPTDALNALTNTLSDWAEIDTDALLIRIKEIRGEADGISAIFPTADGNRRMTTILTSDYEAVAVCNTRCEDGLLLPMNDVFRDNLYRAYREAVRTGHLVMFILTRAGKEIAVRGMLTYAPRTSRKTVGTVKSLEAAGIRVSAFFKDHSDVDIRAAGECGLTETYPALSLSDRGSFDTSLLDEGRRTFTNCTAEQIADCIRALREQGRTVGVLSVEHEDVALLNAADVAMTCSPSLYASAEEGHPRLAGGSVSGREAVSAQDGIPLGQLATDITRRRADVVVRRATTEGGGILGIRRAFLCADHIKDTTDQVFGFTLLSQAARLLLLILSAVLGVGLPSSVALLLSGMGIDLLILLSAVGLPHAPTPRPRRSMEQGIVNPHVTYFNQLVAVTAAVTLPVLAAAVCRFLGVEFGGDLSHFLFLCLVGLQLAIYRSSPLPRRDGTVFVTTMALLLFYVAVLAVALTAGLYPLWALAIPLASPAVYLMVFLILKRARRAKR